MHRAWLERWLIPLRRVLGETTFAEYWATGQALGADAAVTVALEDRPPTSDQLGPGVARDKPEPRRLTAREWEVAELLSRGLTNRQIAQELVVSERTAEWHVAHILGKLGLATRTQVALAIVQQAGPAASQ
jgi:DNA-binding NarL/FixJ family response regulator